MLRVITGIAKNTPLKTPYVEGYRGVQEIAKGAIFSIIGEEIKDSICLDLYAGSGNLGIEALSRGAKWCDFVDLNKSSVKCILDNLKKCKFENYEVFNKDSVKYVANTDKIYNYVFLDPFYDDTNHIFLMQNIEEILNPEKNMVIFLHGDKLDVEKVISKTNLKIIDERKYGKSFASFLKKVI